MNVWIIWNGDVFVGVFISIRWVIEVDIWLCRYVLLEFLYDDLEVVISFFDICW